MKKLLLVIGLLGVLGFGLSSCLGNEVEDKYKDWRKTNNEWFEQQQANTTYYKTVTAPWDPNGQVLIHWYNDTMLTRDNLKPLLTSGVEVKYRGMLYDGTPFDSSYLSTSPRDSIAQFTVNSVIDGWSLGVMMMLASSQRFWILSMAHDTLAAVLRLTTSIIRQSSCSSGNCSRTNGAYSWFVHTKMFSLGMSRAKRSNVSCSCVCPVPKKSINCLGFPSRLQGHSLRPLPPASITPKCFSDISIT